MPENGEEDLKQLLRHEVPALLITLISALLLALGSDDWRFAFVPFLFLAWWLYLRLLRLERWIDEGMKPAKAPHDSGLGGEIVRRLLRRERASRKRKKRINALLRRIDSQIAALPDATLILGRHLEIEWSNAPAEVLLGIRYPADRGQQLGNLLRDEKLLRYIRDPEGRKPRECPSPTDPAIQLRFRAVPIDKNQRLLIVRNVSEQKQMEAALKQFVAHASHELKTPLTTISGYLEMLEEEPALSDGGQQALRVASEQAARMETLIRDLLQLSRLESRSLEPDEGKELPLAELTRRLIDSLPAEQRRRITLESEESLRLRGIKLDIESILQNLLDNALKYTDGPVLVGWHSEEDGAIRLEVRDRGPGIDPQELEAIRQHYYRGKDTTARQIPGSGLGLTIVEQSARLHGGHLAIESDPATGSRFSVTFPAWRNVDHDSGSGKILRL